MCFYCHTVKRLEFILWTSQCPFHLFLDFLRKEEEQRQKHAIMAGDGHERDISLTYYPSQLMVVSCQTKKHILLGIYNKRLVHFPMDGWARDLLNSVPF